MANKRQEQIEEMAKICCNPCEMGCGFDGECCLDNDYKTCTLSTETAEALYEAGFRKQIEAEWIPNPGGGWLCGHCKKYSTGLRNFCPECGAKMKGGAE